MDETKAIAETLVKVMVPGMKPKAVFEAVRQHHPKALKKEIVRAAFYALTDVHSPQTDKAFGLQDFALNGRGGD